MESKLVGIFNKHYHEESAWGGGSGWGSRLNFNISYIEWLKNFIVANQIRTIVDIGCGDWQFSKALYYQLNNIKYLGIDCVQSVIDTNNKQYPMYAFQCHEISEDITNIPNSDIYIIKDVLQHWCEDRIYKFLNNLTTQKKYKYIIICNCKSKFRADIKDGEWRPLSSQHYPLSIFNPISVFQYHTKEVCIIQGGASGKDD
jgi:SAM-dependent methyltransferase